MEKKTIRVQDIMRTHFGRIDRHSSRQQATDCLYVTVAGRCEQLVGFLRRGPTGCQQRQARVDPEIGHLAIELIGQEPSETTMTATHV